MLPKAQPAGERLVKLSYTSLEFFKTASAAARCYAYCKG
ncbi:Uncharacterised protein [Pannonibacter phragmitetus]|uniref:Uncharacterized protein n=1 Tax=Pannonibacter phragmitetus TaxID=121719 RepID=A0A378ZY01_9HYPH|nr:Uncharacterised protein [Pannonibacter phragmitetus]